MAVSAGSWVGVVLAMSEGAMVDETDLDRPEHPLPCAVFLGCFAFDSAVLLHFFEKLVGYCFGYLVC